MLVGFAWGGKNVVVSYPTTKLPEELFAVCDTAGELKTRKENDSDIRVLETTLAKIGAVEA